MNEPTKEPIKDNPIFTDEQRQIIAKIHIGTTSTVSLWQGLGSGPPAFFRAI